MVVPRKHRTVVENTHPCGICRTQPFKYICPRCNLRYCSLTCYKDQSHVQCTESFYKSSVMSELKSSPATTPQDRKKMLGILDRFERQAVDEEQLLTMSDEDLLRHAQHRQHQQDASSGGIGEPTGPTGTTTSSTAQRKLTPRERDELIRKAMEEEAVGTLQEDNENIDPADREEMERMIEQEYQDFVSRFAGVDLEKESFESIWERLNPEERREFQEKFMISGRMDEDHEDEEEIDEDSQEANVQGISDDDNEDEEREAKKLLQEMGETLERGGQKVDSEGVAGQPMTADLDMDDLRAIRDAEIAELIQIWRPWWEVEAEEGGQLKKVVVSKVTDKEKDEQESGRLQAATNIILQDGATTGNLPKQLSQTTKKAHGSDTVMEQFVLDEEAMLRPHQALVRPVEEVEQEAQQRAQATVPPMTREPHPSLIYHVCGLLFAYAATIRVFNGDLQEEPEQVLAHIFDLCPFFAPPPAPPKSKSLTSGSVSGPAAAATMQQSQVDDFETTLAVLQTSSLNSKLWKGDTVRLEMLSLLLRDLTLILVRPARCLRCIRDLKSVFQTCLDNVSKRKGGLMYSKATLHRVFKKLEFYESYLVSEEWMMKSDRLDRVRTEVVMAGIRVRQEIVGWNEEIEKVSRVQGQHASEAEDVSGGSSGGRETGSGEKGKKVLIEELS
ncbi:Zinc finger HIT domain-containing protein 2 [Mortierella sp. GBA35]|nr:Zinc finger HIT domain-containing protein 2 [Mortierella sp. GBA35]